MWGLFVAVGVVTETAGCITWVYWLSIVAGQRQTNTFEVF